MRCTIDGIRSRALHAGRTALPVSSFVLLLVTGLARGADTRVQNYAGNHRIASPCFAAGDQAGAVFEFPAGEYPLEITAIGIAWGSRFGGAGQVTEQAIHVYAGAVPNPGLPVFTLTGPLMTSGAMNAFDVEDDHVRIDSGPVTVSLEFARDNDEDAFAPSVVHDGNGCEAGKNAVRTAGHGWQDACAAGFTGDWVFYLEYCSLGPTAVDAPRSSAFAITGIVPNPFNPDIAIHFRLPAPARVDAEVWSVDGRCLRTLANAAVFGEGEHLLRWDGRNEDGQPAASGVYFVRVRAGSETRVGRMVLLK